MADVCRQMGVSEATFYVWKMPSIARTAAQPVRALRSAPSTQLDPGTSWMIMRSMKTLSLRMRASADNAARVAGYLTGVLKVASVHYLGNLTPGDPRTQVFARQCKSAGSTFSFPIRGGETKAFRMLEALIRISAGIENAGDLIADLEQALEKIRR